MIIIVLRFLFRIKVQRETFVDSLLLRAKEAMFVDISEKVRKEIWDGEFLEFR
jgi:hypothetical protein